MTRVGAINVVPAGWPDLAAALERFEVQFTYPLGPGRWFRISHGADYPRFFRAVGEAACLVAERDGTVLGTLGAAACALALPDGSRQPVAYLGDLKVAPGARGGRVLPMLANAARAWAEPRCRAAFAVVMDGTPVAPERYTGRLGIPAFRPTGAVEVMRFAASEELLVDSAAPAPEAQGRAAFDRLAAGRYHTDGGDPRERSETEPVWLVAADGSACGRVEDTARAKRLFSDDGGEIRSAHLSCFGYHDPPAAARLLTAALAAAARRGSPALFVAVPPAEGRAVRALLPGVPVTVAPATVYAAGLEPGPQWAVNTAEV